MAGNHLKLRIVSLNLRLKIEFQLLYKLFSSPLDDLTAIIAVGIEDIRVCFLFDSYPTAFATDSFFPTARKKKKKKKKKKQLLSSIFSISSRSSASTRISRI